jgi:hypothetical protein
VERATIAFLEEPQNIEETLKCEKSLGAFKNLIEENEKLLKTIPIYTISLLETT